MKGDVRIIVDGLINSFPDRSTKELVTLATQLNAPQLARLTDSTLKRYIQEARQIKAITIEADQQVPWAVVDDNYVWTVGKDKLRFSLCVSTVDMLFSNIRSMGSTLARRK